ncbi:13238_t:CDS:2 [Funneliformis mosseae]|uniref:13238_t:CDS:1 n=1 Tax=Funneliformis mosseae TaxID=27381 RepID=A0A9N9DBL9_FUNMO|nr:13238_t:CDS:2 [Funneliformis mosseae]
MDDDNDIDTEVNSFGEESDLIISNTLNLDADVFINNLDKIIEDSLEENLEGERNIQNVVEKENDINIEWDPIAEAEKIVNSISYGVSKITEIMEIAELMEILAKFRSYGSLGRISKFNSKRRNISPIKKQFR